MADEPMAKIDTDIDSFYNMIVRQGQVKLDEACNALNLEKKHILKYAEVLERGKKIKAKYPFFGQPVFSLPAGQKPNPSEPTITPKVVKASTEASTGEEKQTREEESQPQSGKQKEATAQQQEQQAQCPNCGNPLKSNAKFCTKCGSEVKK